MSWSRTKGVASGLLILAVGLALVFGRLGGPDLVLFGLIALLLWGARRLPEIGRRWGETIRDAEDSEKIGYLCWFIALLILLVFWPSSILFK